MPSFRTSVPARRGSLALATAVSVFLLQVSLVHAQSDFDPPLIEHDVIEMGEPGTPQEFSASVVDDQGLEQVILFYRFEGDEEFEQKPMSQVASSPIHSTTIETDADETRAIEYYIRATDESGNRVVKGYQFEPMVRRMASESNPAPGARSGSGSPEVASGSGRRWLYIGLGVLAVGAIAAAAGGGSDDPPSEEFTLILDPPQ